MKNSIVKMQNVQVMDIARVKQEVFVLEGTTMIPATLSKNANSLIAKIKPMEDWIVDCKGLRMGPIYYWYTDPLFNYYHLILDGLGQLSHYFDLKREIPDLKLFLNQSPKAKSGCATHPPFVTELLDLFEIDYEFTDENIQYDTVYFGDTLNQDARGKRVTPADRQYQLLHELINRAKNTASAPQHERVYLSRRASANPMLNRKDVIGEDNTVKRGLVNEDEVVEILSGLGYTEVFGENYTLAEKIVLFNGMKKYISAAGAGVTNILWTMPNSVSVGGIHTPGFPFPSNNHSRHICCNKKYVNATIDCYKGKVCFVDEAQGAKNYNSPWYINNLDAFKEWAATI